MGTRKGATLGADRGSSEGDQVLRLEQVVRILGRHRTTVYKYIAAEPDDPRHLPSFLVGDGARRFLAADVDALKVRLAALDIDAAADAEVYSMGAPQIARRLNISNRSAGRLLSAGVIPSRWVGQQRRARPQAVEDYIADLAR